MGKAFYLFSHGFGNKGKFLRRGQPGESHDLGKADGVGQPVGHMEIGPQRPGHSVGQGRPVVGKSESGKQLP